MDQLVRFSLEVGVTLLASWALLSGWVIYRQRQELTGLRCRITDLSERVTALSDQLSIADELR